MRVTVAAREVMRDERQDPGQEGRGCAVHTPMCWAGV